MGTFLNCCSRFLLSTNSFVLKVPVRKFMCNSCSRICVEISDLKVTKIFKNCEYSALYCQAFFFLSPRWISVGFYYVNLH